MLWKVEMLETGTEIGALRDNLSHADGAYWIFRLYHHLPAGYVVDDTII